jgi:hypothetical protein
VAETSTGKPYKDTPLDYNRFVRKFYHSVESDELIWHRDKKNRTVKVLEGNGWFLQFEDKLPEEMKKNEVYRIEAETYHRIIKGKGNLILEIREE